MWLADAMLAARAYEASKLELRLRYFPEQSRDADDEASYISINVTDDGSGAETDNTYESIKSRLLEDSPHTAESHHESTSSGIVSDVVAYNGPSQYPFMSTFKAEGPSHGIGCTNCTDTSITDCRSLDDCAVKSSAWASSPQPKSSTPTPDAQQVHSSMGHNHRLSPASPLAYKYSLTNRSVYLSSCSYQLSTDYGRQKVHDMEVHENVNCGEGSSLALPAGSGVVYGLIAPTSCEPLTYPSTLSTKGKYQFIRLSPFEVLSDEVVLKIFCNLPTDILCRSARVCRRWYQLVWDPTLWTSIFINHSGIDVDRALKYLTRRLSYNTPKVCVILERVNLNGCEQLTDKGLHTVVKRCPELRYLELQSCTKLTNVGIFEAVSYCVNLEHLDISGCTEITCIRLMTGAAMENTMSSLQLLYLHYLDMTDCVGLQDAGLALITTHCMQLQFLFLRRCYQITDVGLQHVANKCYCLRELSVSDCRHVTDLGLRELSKLGDSLRYLSVAKCDQVSDQGVRYIAKRCSRLRYLNVRGCEAVSDNSLDYISRHCPRLRSLDIGKCDITDEGLQILAHFCPQLRKLSLKSCENVTDKGVVLLAYHCRGLQQLNIQECLLSPEAYRTIKKYCKRCLIEHTNPGFF